MKVVIYPHITQDYKRQIVELKEYSEKMGFYVIRTFKEKISVGKNNEDRPKLMVNFIKETRLIKSYVGS